MSEETFNKRTMNVDVDIGVLRQAIRSLNRQPFRDMLARLMENAPTADAIQTFADKSPDRWSQAVAICGRLAGYSDKTIVEHDVTAKITHMSDAELIA